MVDHRLVGDLHEKRFVLAIHGRRRYHHAVKLAAAGDNALLVELGEVAAAELHAAAARVRALPGTLACIPGHSSLYVVTVGAPDRNAVARAVAGASSPAAATPSGTVHRLRVRFDDQCGPDLGELLRRVGREAFLSRITSLRLTARYIGFRGGFAYLDGWPEEWAMPRRPTSRPLVPHGTFGVAGSAVGFYPIDSPGGWNLLGRTDADLEHAIAPGDTIVLQPDAALRFDGPRVSPVAREGAPPEMLFEVLSGPLSRVVGAPAWSGVERGIPPGGPFDAIAAARAIRAAGNAEAAPLLECAIAGPRIRMTRDAFVAWCAPDLRVAVRRLSMGEEMSFGRIEGGLRAYLAAGALAGRVERALRDDRLRIRALAGPHPFPPGEVECEVTPRLDRVGIRLVPLRPLDIEAPSDLRSIGMQCGTIQLHPDGTLVAMGPDHPVTGGYLQPMTVLTSERWKLAQLVPGERVVVMVSVHPERGWTAGGSEGS